MTTRPDKYLKYDDKNYVGYFQQLTTIIRSDSHADDLLDELLGTPLCGITTQLKEGPQVTLLY